MLIEKFIVPANELVDLGLQPIEINRLGRFVVLAGKNGAGKSRILNKLESCIQHRNQHVGNMAGLAE